MTQELAVIIFISSMITFIIGVGCGVAVQLGKRQRIIVYLSVLFFHGSILGFLLGTFVDALIALGETKVLNKVFEYLKNDIGSK